MKAKHLIVILIILIVGISLIHVQRKVSLLSSRIERIENKLGGYERIDCSEKYSIRKVRGSVVRIVGGESEGSGFAFKQNGFILTNFHVISSEPNPKVVFADNTFEVGEVIAADKHADLAIVKVKRNIPILKFAKVDDLTPAEDLWAIGYPLGGGLPGDSFVIRGAFSRCILDKKNDVRHILTDMTLIAGISGGPMINMCGEVVGINTAGLFRGGMGIAISSDSIIERLRMMDSSKEPLKDVRRIVFKPNENPLEAVRAFYGYLKERQLDKAFELLSDNFISDMTFDEWALGYREMLDTTVRVISPDRKEDNKINIKISSKDLIEDEIIYKYFEGSWDVRKIKGEWILYRPQISQIDEPPEHWYLDLERIYEIEEFTKNNKDSQEYNYKMYEISQEAGNEGLSVQELYEMAKK